MGERDFEDITPEGLINRLHTHEPSSAHTKHKQGAEPLNTEVIRERFLNALKEIAHLEKALEEKNSALASTAEEKDRLFHALNKAFEDKKKLQDRIADIDIVRNMEIVDFKTGLDKLTDERDFLLKEKDELIEDIYKRDRTIEELKSTIEKKGLQLQEIQADMDTALEVVRKTELKCKELETHYKAVEQRQSGYAKTSRKVESPAPLILNNLPQDTETEPEYPNKIEYLTNTLAALKKEVDEKKDEFIREIPEAENVFLRNEISLNLTDSDRDSISSSGGDETPDTEDISIKLALAAGRYTAASPREETAAKKLSADKKLLYVKSPIDTESGSQFSEKMIYTAPVEDIKKKALRIAILFALGAAGILLAYKFF
jgi:chromosome segregation ATPase